MDKEKESQEETFLYDLAVHAWYLIFKKDWTHQQAVEKVVDDCIIDLEGKHIIRYILAYRTTLIGQVSLEMFNVETQVKALDQVKEEEKQDACDTNRVKKPNQI